MAEVRGDPPGDTSASIGATLLVLGAALAERGRGGGPAVRGSLEISDGFGFVVGVLADYGIPAARAWALPELLRRRIGSLDPNWVSSDPTRVAAALGKQPAPHRFGPTLGRWIVHAAERVRDGFEGRAAQIWTGVGSASELQRRFMAFDGIGQKKAAMAVQLLLGAGAVTLDRLADTEVAYDVHVRRVFLRAGLAEEDSPRAIIAAAALLWKQDPGALDLPAWYVGRTFCRPRAPLCDRCALARYCPRLLEAVAEVRGP